jgi:hypothetical protein
LELARDGRCMLGEILSHTEPGNMGDGGLLALTMTADMHMTSGPECSEQRAAGWERGQLDFPFTTSLCPRPMPGFFARRCASPAPTTFLYGKEAGAAGRLPWSDMAISCLYEEDLCRENRSEASVLIGKRIGRDMICSNDGRDTESEGASPPDDEPHGLTSTSFRKDFRGLCI